MKVRKALAKNFAIPVIDEVLGYLPESTQKLQIKGAWLAFKIAYGLFDDLYPEKSEEFLKQVREHVFEIGNELVESKDFQQALVITFETLLRTRDERKRRLIKTIFLDGYISAEDRQTFYLERFYRVAQEISLDALQHLRFIDEVVMPMKIDAVNKKVAEMNKENRDNDDEWWFKHTMTLEPDSQYITQWVHNEFNPNSKIVQARVPNVNTNKKIMSMQFEKEKAQSAKFSEYSSELISLGIFRLRDALMGGGLAFSYTDFGKKFVKYANLIE